MYVLCFTRPRYKVSVYRTIGPCSLALIDQVVSEEKLFENNGCVHVYSPGTGADSPLG